MKQKPATIKDIARILGLSTSTVSRALRDMPEVSPQTKEDVKRLAKELKYQPNIVALGLVKSRTRVLGVIMPHIEQPFYSSAISGIEDTALDAGYNVMICQSNEQLGREENAIQVLSASRVDGFIICPSEQTTDFAHINNQIDMGTPLVMFDRVSGLVKASQIVSDDRKGAFEVVEHLIAQGYRKIAHITGPEHLSISQNRKAGYLEALAAHGLSPEKNHIVSTALNAQEVRNAAKSLLQLPNRPDAIFAVNDPTAVETLVVIREAGLDCPQEIGLAGFDNQPITAYMTPSITTVMQPSYEMGRKAARLLLEQIQADEDTDFPTRTIVMNTSLVARASSQK